MTPDLIEEMIHGNNNDKLRWLDAESLELGINQQTDAGRSESLYEVRSATNARLKAAIVRPF